MTASLTILFLVLMFLGMPVAFAIGVSFMLFYLLGPAPAMISVQKIVVSTQNFPLLAIPLFIFAGHLMNHSGITERLIKLSTVMTGWISGGLAHVAINSAFASTSSPSIIWSTRKRSSTTSGNPIRSIACWLPCRPSPALQRSACGIASRRRWMHPACHGCKAGWLWGGCCC